MNDIRFEKSHTFILLIKVAGNKAGYHDYQTSCSIKLATHKVTRWFQFKKCESVFNRRKDNFHCNLQVEGTFFIRKSYWGVAKIVGFFHTIHFPPLNCSDDVQLFFIRASKIQWDHEVILID